MVYGGHMAFISTLAAPVARRSRQALKDQMGVEVSSVEPFGLGGSAGSSPMQLRRQLRARRDLFGKLDAWLRVRADCRYKLGRQLMYGLLEDGKSFTGVRRLVQQEDYALRLVR